MSRRSTWSRVTVLAALGMSLGLPAAHAAVGGPTVPLHTATAARNPRAHRHHRHTQILARGADQVAARPCSGAPPEWPGPRQPNRHKATIPSLTHNTRHAPRSNTGARHSSTPSSSTVITVLAARALEPHQDTGPDPRKHPVTSGRGPPRGSPMRLPRGRASTAPASAFDPDARPRASATVRSPRPPPPAIAVRARISAARTEPRRPPVLFVSNPRSAAGRLHAARPEGATVCFMMPSDGGTPCPASSPSPHSRSCSAS